MSLQVYTYQNCPVSFDRKKTVMINASQMVKPFHSKRMNDFTSNKQTVAFVELLESKTGIPVLTIKHGGKSNGTWMHQKLALKFAAWLSPEFELWVFDRIEEILLASAPKPRAPRISNEDKIKEAFTILYGENQQLKAKIDRQVTLIRERNEQVRQLQQYNPARTVRLPSLAEIKQKIMLPPVPVVPQVQQVVATTPQVDTLKHLLGPRYTSKLAASTGLTTKQVARMVNKMDTSHKHWPQVLELAKRHKEALAQTSQVLNPATISSIDQLPY